MNGIGDKNVMKGGDTAALVNKRGSNKVNNERERDNDILQEASYVDDVEVFGNVS
jgi:hypothetical protein